MVSPRRFALAVTLAVVVVTSGCVSGPLSEQQEDKLADRIESELADVDAYEATVTTQVTIRNETTTTRTHVKADAEDGTMWRKVLAPDDRAGDLMVSNGSVLWSYDASENTVQKYDFDTSLGATGIVGNTSRVFSDLTDNYDVTVKGTESVNGTEARVVELTPENDTAEHGVAGTGMTVWLDTSSHFPVKVHQEFDLGDDTYESTIWYENLTLNPDFESGTFDYEPPADAEVEQVATADTDQYDSESALRDAANRSIPAPELPADFEFDQGVVTNHDGDESVTAVYANGSATVRVATYPGSQYSADGENVTVGDHEATLSTYDDTAMVTWTCDGVRYSVVSTAGEALARSVAASIPC